MEDFLEKLESTELVRWLFCDLSGNARTKLIPGRMSAHFVAKQPRRFCTAVIPMACNSDLPELAWVLDNGYPDCEMIPEPDTFHLVSWSRCCKPGTAKSPIGQVLCSTRWPADDSNCAAGPVQFDPRNAAKSQLDRLADMGLALDSSAELQWRLCVQDSTGKSGVGCWWPEHPEPLSSRLAHRHEPLLGDLCDALHSGGVAVEEAGAGAGRGQLCVSLGYRRGVRAADEAFLGREIVKQVAANHNLLATFMPSPHPGEHQSASSLVYRHSLVPLGKKKKEKLINSEDLQELSLSRQWLAGLVAHSPAIAALSWPTLNCYRGGRRCGQSVAWSLQQTDSDVATASKTTTTAAVPDFCLRRRHGGATAASTTADDRSYGSRWLVESHLASSAASAHIVLAATVAAGIDGIQRRLALPEAEEAAPTLPASMPDALAALSADSVIGEALGSQLVEFYRQVKLQFDLAKVGAVAAPEASMKIKGEEAAEMEAAALRREAEFYLEFH